MRSSTPLTWYHTLDLIITRQSDQLLGNTPRISRYISDHATVLCSIRCDKPPLSVRKVSYRKLHSVNVVSLNEDLATSELCQNPSDDLQELVSSYNNTLMAALDKHAPLMTRTIVQRPRVPWFSQEIREAKRQRRKAEKRWRKSRLESDLAAFKAKRNLPATQVAAWQRDPSKTKRLASLRHADKTDHPCNSWPQQLCTNYS